MGKVEKQLREIMMAYEAEFKELSGHQHRQERQAIEIMGSVKER